jgi:hypothetical protein
VRWLDRIAVFTLGAFFATLAGAFVASPDHPAIQYNTAPVTDPVAQLNRKIQDGKVQLKFEDARGYLRSALEALDIPIESQMLVFSKTSLQMHLIHPRNPRSIFFNDHVVVAWVPGEPFVEVAAEDPRQGVIFYGLNQARSDLPMFRRRDDCVTCHDSYSSLGVPGMLLRSVFPATDGTQLRQFGDTVSDHRTPLEERWGGWYVTAKQGPARHRGNAMVTDLERPEAIANEKGNIQSLEGKFDTSRYLSHYSDIVALMIFEHQLHLINLFTRYGWDVRAASYEENLVSAFATSGHPESTLTYRLLRDGAAEIADYMLFVDEAPLTARIQGTSGFAEKFSAQGPRDRNGRSLRQLDLETRLMRYPLSYMIYSEAFDALPPDAREAAYRRMWRILSGEEKDSKYTRLSRADRKAIVEILRDTKPNLPDYFQPVE